MCALSGDGASARSEYNGPAIDAGEPVSTRHTTHRKATICRFMGLAAALFLVVTGCATEQAPAAHHGPVRPGPQPIAREGQGIRMAMPGLPLSFVPNHGQGPPAG